MDMEEKLPIENCLLVSEVISAVHMSNLFQQFSNEFLRIPVSNPLAVSILGFSHEQSILSVEFLKIYMIIHLMNL